ncbi:thiamine pyrophosphokinase 1-like protein [Leptotrombidium deliense]|uniref:Thiamine pyrophosphokinase 1-like protein n=1 Tax=Leptotrombidium deliense TaxID=299467 RepID=A0A443SR98_9ACAR|nr:thiamine pyrophosphokinase 1-like protein [Leptotrombidium deliense]
MPDIVCGDFDSIKPTVLEYYKQQKNVKVIETPDQDDTDFTKAVKELLTEVKDKGIKLDRIIVFWSTSGRFDHIMSIIHTLYLMLNVTSIPLFLYNVNTSLSWVLKPGLHTIESNAHSSWCALMPIGEPCVVTSQGLRWNLSEHKLAFGSLISTSNEFDFKNSEKVKIKTDKALMWSMDTSNNLNLNKNL